MMMMLMDDFAFTWFFFFFFVFFLLVFGFGIPDLISAPWAFFERTFSCACMLAGVALHCMDRRILEPSDG